MSLETLRQSERATPLHYRADILAHDAKSYAKERRQDFTALERMDLEAAIHCLERLSMSIRTNAEARKGALGPRPNIRAVE